VRHLTLAVALIAIAAPLHAQRVHDTPARPALFASADTNSANAYYMHGVQVLDENPREAAASFYWAARLRPGWADPIYGRRIALLLSDPRRLVNYMDGNRGTLRSAEIRGIDSLQLRALQLDPFLHQRMDRALLTRYFMETYSQYLSAATGRRNDANATFVVNEILHHPQLDPFLKAWFAYSDGRFPLALGEYERALRQPRAVKSRLYTDIGRMHFLAGNTPGALDNLISAIDELRQDDARDLVHLYESKAILEHSIAVVQERSGNASAAREAYGRAAQEDLAYYPAHARLGALALSAHDTATALSELALAVELAPAEAHIRYQYALVLMTAGKTAEADAELVRALESEPYYAAPHLVRGAIALQVGKPAEAVTHLSEFLARAARDDPQRGAAEQALATARASAGAQP
jgi:tetratricopeptide (TPR) repeat protein